MKLIVGLGNPGTEYEKTRHNVGWRVLDMMQLDFSFEKKFTAEVAKRGDIWFCKPHTFMNNSGTAVRALAEYYHIAPQDIIALYDDKDIPFGTIRIRTSGSSGGHNGVASLIQHLGTMEFTRIRIGIASTVPQANTANFVLARFSAEEEIILPRILTEAKESVEEIMNAGVSKATHQDKVVPLE